MKSCSKAAFSNVKTRRFKAFSLNLSFSLIFLSCIIYISSLLYLFLFSAQAAEAHTPTWWGAGNGRHAGPPDPWWPWGGHGADGRSASATCWGRHLPHHLQAHFQGHAHRPTGWGPQNTRFKGLDLSPTIIHVGSLNPACHLVSLPLCSGWAGGDSIVPHCLSDQGEEDLSHNTNGPVCPGGATAALLHLPGIVPPPEKLETKALSPPQWYYGTRQLFGFLTNLPDISITNLKGVISLDNIEPAWMTKSNPDFNITHPLSPYIHSW